MGRAKLRHDLENSWAAFHWQYASVDLRQRDNEFHGASYVDFKSGKLKHAFTGVVEKSKRGAISQIQAFKQCISRLYPQSEKVKPQDVWKLFREHREKHLNDLGEDVNEEIEWKEHEPAPGFDDDDEVDLSLLT